MLNLTAKPTWQFSSKNTSARSFCQRATNAGIAPLKQALLPRSLDLSFEFKYRR